MASDNPLARARTLACATLLLYLLARVPDLLSIPLSHDEAVYILRATRFPAMVWWTLGEGKFLYEVLLAAMIQLPGDPLLLSRLLAVAGGLGTLVVMLLIARSLGRPVAGIIAGVLYVGAPMAVLHDRLGMSDSLLTFVSCLVLWASINYARAPQPRRWQPAAIGVLIIVAGLVKLPGLFLIFTPALAVLVLTDTWAERRRRLALLGLTLSVALLCIAALAYAGYGIFERKQAAFTSIDQRIALLGQCLGLFCVWVLAYLPAPLLFLPAFLALRRRASDPAWRIVLLLFASSVALILTFLTIGTTIFSRYLMPAWPAILLACAISVDELWRADGRSRLPGRVLCVVALGAALAWDGYFVAQLMRNPPAAPLAAPDRYQYVESWTAGYHLPEIMAALEAKADEHGGIVLATQERVRLIQVAPLIYLRHDPRVTVEMLELTADSAPQRLHELAAQRPAYVLLDDDELRGYDFARRFPETRLLGVYENPIRTMRFYLYEQPSP